jgi:hypothetical protein
LLGRRVDDEGDVEVVVQLVMDDGLDSGPVPAGEGRADSREADPKLLASEACLSPLLQGLDRFITRESILPVRA